MLFANYLSFVCVCSMALLLRARWNAGKLFGVGMRAFSTGGMQKQKLSESKVYELRTYTLKPEKFIDYMRFTYEHIGKRTQHSKLCGFWSVELGGTLSEVVHIWEYDSYSHRTEVRKALSQDDKWQNEYMQHLMGMLVRQESVTMRAVPWYPVQKFMSTGGIYELWTKTLVPGKQEQLEHRLLQGIPAQCKLSPPVGIWFNELGPKNKVHILMNYKDIDERCRVRETLLEDEEWRETVRDTMPFYVDLDSKILTPTQFSPWK